MKGYASEDMDKWKIIHDYRRLQKNGLAAPWLCPRDEESMVSMIGRDDEPVLWCYTCETKVIPGLMMYENMLSVIKEFDA